MITQTVIHPDAAGIDLASEVHYVAVPADRDPQPVRNFGTTTDQLIVLADWLQRCGIRTVAMEATGVYCIPLFELLEARGRKSAWSTALPGARDPRRRACFFWRGGIGTRTGRCSARNERRGK
jgi:transposase